MDNLQQSYDVQPRNIILQDESILTPYTVIDTSLGEIRLVEIKPGRFNDPIEIELQIANLCFGAKYYALSYVWSPEYGIEGKIGDSVKVKNFKGYAISIGENLEAAIRHVRKRDRSITMWIDALSINQKNTQERNHQVGIMSQIYSLAEDVIIWLGPAQGNSDFLMDTIRKADLKEYHIIRFLDGFEHVLRRDWFGRVWIAQELTLARRDPIVFCGHKSLSWSRFIGAVRSERVNLLWDASGSLQYHGHGYKYIFKPESDYQHLAQAFRKRADCAHDLAEIRDDGPNVPLSKQLSRTRHLSATDPRDRVYGLLGIARSHRPSLAVDYSKSLVEIYSDAMATILSETFPAAYSLFKLRHSYSDLPSWVPDFRRQGRILHKAEETLVPQDDTIQDTIRAAYGLAPHFRISKGSEGYCLTTVGKCLGTLTLFKTIIGGDRYARVAQREDLTAIVKSAVELNISSSTIIQALLGPSSAPTQEVERLSSALNLLIAEYRHDPGACKFEVHDSLQRLLQYSSGICLFMTDTGLVGICYPRNKAGLWPTIENLNGCILAGLFGINFPFVLRMSPDPTSCRILSVAHVAKHRWGHSFVENAPPGTQWTDLYKYGLEQFVIV